MRSANRVVITSYSIHYTKLYDVILEKSLLDTTAADYDRLMAVNLRGVFLVGREALRILRRQGTGGRVINIASDLGYFGRENS